MKATSLPVWASAALIWALGLCAAQAAVFPGALQPGSRSLEGAERAAVLAHLGKLPLHFIENRGQADPQVAFYLQSPGRRIYFTPTGVTFVLDRPDPAAFDPEGSEELEPPGGGRRWVVKLDFLGADGAVRPSGRQPHAAVVSYFKGPQESWQSGLPTFGRIVYQELWPGIDLVFSGEGGVLKATYHLKPGADPGRIRLAYRGAEAVGRTAAGRLRITTPIGGFEEDTPYAFQEIAGITREVAAEFVLEGEAPQAGVVYGFRLGEYDRSQPLVLDPAVYCGYIGGSGADVALGIAVDREGNIYISGQTQSTEATFPVVAGGFDVTYNTNADAFVAKVNPSMTGLIYCSFLGGTGAETNVNRIAVDGEGSAYIVGWTNSSDFPVAGGWPYTSRLGGTWDGFVAKVNAAGTALVYSGYLGGSGNNDWVRNIAVDASGCAYLVGNTDSSNFPTTSGAFDTTYNGGSTDVFVAKVNAAGTALLYSTFIGGSGSEQGYSIAIDAAGNAYITGVTASTEGSFPVTAGPDLTHNGGTFDAFVAKLNASGTALVYCGYIGGSGNDQAFGIAIDGAGNAYVTGMTDSSAATFPVTVGPDLTYNGGLFDAFVARVNAAGTALDYCGYIGGSGEDRGQVIALDAAGNAYVAGYTASTEGSFPVAGGPDLTHNGGTNDAFVAKLNASGTALVYCGYLGGSGDDRANGIAIDGGGVVYIVGQTGSDESTFPVAGGPDLTLNGGNDAFVAKISPYVGPLLAYTELNGATDDIIRFRNYLGAAWTAEGTAYDSDDAGVLKWHTAVTSPDGTRQAVLAVGSGSNTLYAALYDGWSWSTHNLGTINTASAPCFSAAYEQTSGRLVIAAGTSTSSQIKYWVRSGDTWLVNGGTVSFSGGADLYGPLNVVRMDSRPGSNEIALIALASGGNVGGVVWNGVDSWGNQKKLNSGLALNGSKKLVDVKYMRAGAYRGQALFAFGVNGLTSWTWNGSSWESAAKTKSVGSGTLWLELAADPNSSKLLAAVGDQNDSLHTVDWGGAEWGTARTVTTSLWSTTWYGRRFAVAFESGASHLGHAVIAYSDTANLKYRHTSDITGAWGAETNLDAGADCNFVQLARDVTNTLHLACQADGGAGTDTLKAYAWDNAAWTSQGTLEADLQSDSNGAYEAFAITAGSERTGLTQLHFRWRRDSGPESPPVFKIQSYQGSMGSGAATKSVPIEAVAGLGQAFILSPGGKMSVGVGSGGVQQNADEVLVRARFTAVNEITLTRGVGTGDSDYSFVVVEDVTGDEIYVASGSSSFPNNTSAVLDVGVSGIGDYTKTVVFLSVSSDNASPNYYHQAHVRGTLTSNTNLRLERTAGNSIAAVDWFVVEFKGPGWSVQQGSFDLTTGTHDTPQVLTIGAVDPAKSFVFMNWSASANGLMRTSPKVELANATTLSFSRFSTVTGTTAIRWFVVSHDKLSVQRGSLAAAMNDFAKSQSVTAIDPGKAFPISFNDCNGTGSTYPRPHWRAWFSNSTTLYLERSYSGQPSNFLWQVIDLSGFAGAPFALAEDAKVGVNKLEPLRLRLLVENQGSIEWSTGFQLRVAETTDCKAGTYYAVGGTGAGAHWAVTDSPYISDGEASENVGSGLTDPGGSIFVAGELKDAGATTGTLTLLPGKFTELEYALQATASVTAGGNYCFRLYTSGGQPLDAYSQDAEARINGVTAVRLLEFAARGEGSAVAISWRTGEEVRNKGFDLFRGDRPSGPWVKLNTAGLIPSSSDSGEGAFYRFADTQAQRGRIYYYRLEDIDVRGTRRAHGPVCVDWDGDGLPDDWEIAHGLDPRVDDAEQDPDGDGATNRREHARGTDPLNRDSDGDGVMDGAEAKGPSRRGGEVSDFGPAVTVLAADESGMVLELAVESFDAVRVWAGGEEFERLSLPGIAHGATRLPGRPELPVKGVLIAVPEGRRARLAVLAEEREMKPGFRVYPVPELAAAEEGELKESFVWDEAAYRAAAFWPQAAAELSELFVYRGERRQRVLFHPLRFHAADGKLLFSRRIRVQILFEEDAAERRSTHAAPAAVFSPATGAAYKLSVNAEGIYRVTRAFLREQGIPAADIDSIRLSTVQLFHLGAEQALRVHDADGDGVLGDGDFIEFYGQAVPAAHAKYSRHNAYWLIDAGSPGARRMAAVEGAPAGGPLATSNWARVRHERNQSYLQAAPGPDGMDRWIFSSIAIGSGIAHAQAGLPKSFTLDLPGALGPGELRIRMCGPYDTTHAAAVSVNGSHLGHAFWSGIGYTEAAFPAVNFQPGENTVSVTCESALDRTAFDWFEAHYERDFTAAGDSLLFTHPGGYRYRLEGFVQGDIELFDISDPAAVARVVNGAVTGGGAYGLEVEPAAAAGTRRYLAVSSAGRRTPLAAVKGRGGDLRSGANGADWILITHRELGWENGVERPWVTELTALRQSQGLRTAVVDVTDIYDEFGYGLETPQAIREFLAHAFAHWPPPAPRYLLLVGDATYDYLDHRGLGTVNRVPGYLIYTPHLGETVTDDWYGRVSGEDRLSDLAIGRLPAETPDQAAAMAAKIIAYERAANTKSWQRRTLFVADNAVESWEEIFEAMAEEGGARLAAGLAAPERFYLQEYENESLSAADLNADLTSAIDAGALILHYSGHGSVNILATEKLLDNSTVSGREDVNRLRNAGAFPFVVAMTCLSGYFVYPSAGAYAAGSYLSLAEGFLRPAERGAIAALLPTGMTGVGGQRVLSNALMEALFLEDRRRLGDALAAAKQALLANSADGYPEVSDTFLLFGDPATELKIPLPRRPQGLSARAEGAAVGVALTWSAAADCDGRAVAGYHLYRRGPGETGYRRLTTTPIAGLAYRDAQAASRVASPAALASSAVFVYAVSAIDDDGDESALSAPAIIALADLQDGGRPAPDPREARGCFIGATQPATASLAAGIGRLALFVLLGAGAMRSACAQRRRGIPPRGARRVEKRANA